VNCPSIANQVALQDSNDKDIYHAPLSSLVPPLLSALFVFPAHTEVAAQNERDEAHDRHLLGVSSKFTRIRRLLRTQTKNIISGRGINKTQVAYC
jgi:hypothetical protein